MIKYIVLKSPEDAKKLIKLYPSARSFFYHFTKGNWGDQYVKIYSKDRIAWVGNPYGGEWAVDEKLQSKPFITMDELLLLKSMGIKC